MLKTTWFKCIKLPWKMAYLYQTFSKISKFTIYFIHKRLLHKNLRKCSSILNIMIKNILCNTQLIFMHILYAILVVQFYNSNLWMKINRVHIISKYQNIKSSTFKTDYLMVVLRFQTLFLETLSFWMKNFHINWFFFQFSFD